MIDEDDIPTSRKNRWRLIFDRFRAQFFSNIGISEHLFSCRQRLPKSRVSRTTSFTVGGAEGYMTSGAHDDGQAAEQLLRALLREFFHPLVRLRDTVPGYAVSLVKAGVALEGTPAGPVRPPLVDATPEQVAEPEERLSVRNQIKFLDAAATALNDDFLGFNLARDHDPREIGLLYYVMASSQTLGDALKRIARYSRITNEAVVFRYQEGNLYQSSVSLTRWGFPNQLQNDSRWRTEGRLPWGLPLRCGGTIPAGSFVAWRRE